VPSVPDETAASNTSKTSKTTNTITVTIDIPIEKITAGESFPMTVKFPTEELADAILVWLVPMMRQVVKDAKAAARAEMEQEREQGEDWWRGGRRPDDAGGDGDGNDGNDGKEQE
jgi:hypothetical protein